MGTRTHCFRQLVPKTVTQLLLVKTFAFDLYKRALMATGVPIITSIRCATVQAAEGRMAHTVIMPAMERMESHQIMCLMHLIPFHLFRSSHYHKPVLPNEGATYLWCAQFQRWIVNTYRVIQPSWRSVTHTVIRMCRRDDLHLALQTAQSVHWW